MGGRELVVLGTASQVPTRTRNHNGYLLRWDGEGLLVDPGEGTQRQLTLAGVPASAVTAIALTHAHGDHCFGLPGMLARLALDVPDRPVDLYYPAAAQRQVDALRAAGVSAREVPVVEHPLPPAGGEVGVLAGAALLAEPLDHTVPATGYRLAEPGGRTFLPERLAAAGVEGRDVARLESEGVVVGAAGPVTAEQVSVPRTGQSVAFVLDTRLCPGAHRLASGVDLLVAESTFLDEDADLAAAYGHLTAGQAGRLAAAAGAHRLLVTHFSGRYGEDVEQFADQARRHHPDVLAAVDLQRVPLPPRRRPRRPATGRAGQGPTTRTGAPSPAPAP